MSARTQSPLFQCRGQLVTLAARVDGDSRARWRRIAMITRETESDDAPIGPDTPTLPARAPQPLRHPPRLARHTGVSALVAVILVVGLAAALLAYAAHQRGASSNSNWEPVLKGYTITALAASGSDAAILYACATTWRSDTGISITPG